MADVASLIDAMRRAPLWLGYGLARRRRLDTADHARAAVAWLLRAAKVGGGGFAHSLHLVRGWLPAYPETTGYILPTLALAGRRYGLPETEAALARAWQWLQAIQESDGSFTDLAGRPQVFDTAQVLIGACFQARAGVPEAAAVAERACRWLLREQTSDGSFVTHAYKGRAHAYYSRVGAALLDAGQLLGLPEVIAAGLRNLDWTLAQQQSDGWFEHMSFAEEPPYSHTIVYTLDGLLAGYCLSGQTHLLDAVLRCAVPLREAITKHGGVIRSQYRPGFVPVDEEVCIAGLCQWSALCFRLEYLGIAGFREQAEVSLEAAMRLQLHSPLGDLDGGLPGSKPFSGRYMRFSLPNWAAKFFLDALLQAEGGFERPVLI